METKTDILNVLSLVAKDQNWNNFDVDTNIEHEKGNGFLGEFFMGSIKNKDTGEQLNLAIKKAFKNKTRREKSKMRNVYLNEIYFYSNVVPTLEKFLIEKGQPGMLGMIGKFYLSLKEECNETLVMDNLKEQGYNILGREALLDDLLLQLIFKTYGKFHATSFAFKDQKPEEYATVVNGIDDQFVKNVERISEALISISSESFHLLDESLKIRCKHVFENISELYKKILKYEGNCNCILHGDCWSNNMMFKYKDHVLESIKLVDFQILREGSPVYDLSYVFYAGGSKELFKNLDKYLHIYYDSFTESVGLLGSNGNQLMSFENLKEDWKKYSKFGFFLGLILTKAKLVSSKDVESITDDNNEHIKTFDALKVDNTIFKKRVQDLVEHMCENKFI